MSKAIRLAKDDFVKGKVILVGNRPDYIWGHVAHLLASSKENIQLLKNAKINDSDSIIYLCGHGHFKERDIDKQSIEYIAKALIMAGYTGLQHLYITPCDATRVDEFGLSIYSELERYLKLNIDLKYHGIIQKRYYKELQNCVVSTLGMAKYNSCKSELELEMQRVAQRNAMILSPSDANGKTILVDNNGKTEMWVVDSNLEDKIKNAHKIEIDFENKNLFTKIYLGPFLKLFPYTEKQLARINDMKMRLINFCKEGD